MRGRAYRWTCCGSVQRLHLEQIDHPHKHGTAIRLNFSAVEFGTGGALVAGSTLFERLEAALFSGRKLGFE